MKKLTYRSTMLACYNGYVTQAISINLAPLFYLTFQREYSLTLSEISALIAVNFSAQLCVDLFATLCSGKLNLRLFTVLAHFSTVAGLFGLSLFPELFPPFGGLTLAVALLGIGGGFTEVMISPLLEACPTDEKSGNMSLLHSFYSWGQAGVVLFSSLFFLAADLETSWRYLPWIWAVIPLLGGIAFCLVPIYRLPGDENPTDGHGKSNLLSPRFFCYVLMMFGAGASEMIMSQWASTFAESALGIPKTLGDLLGPCVFAVMMGLTRVFYGKFSKKIRLERLMMYGCILCAASYLLAAWAPVPMLALAGCAVCGLSVGIFWPGILSSASRRIRDAGILMYAVLAFAGDIGCLLGPSIAGKIADVCGGDLRAAFFFALAFPAMNFVLLVLQSDRLKKKN